MPLFGDTLPAFPTVDTADVLGSTVAFLPELIICGGIILMLLLRLLRGYQHTHMGGLALLMTLVALAASVGQWLSTPLYGVVPGLEGPTNNTIFANLLVYDHLTVYLRCFLYGFTALVIWLSLTTGIPDREDSADFYCLLLGATLGMAIMAQAAHLMMVFIGVEMASLPSYALAGYLKGRRQSSEAALKYVVYGGGAAGVMLFGISLLAGTFGTGYLPDVALGVVRSLHPPQGAAFDPVILLGTLLLMVGIGFKVSAVPFHFWCPDVFEGAAAEVAGYLSVASKGAALALLARITLVLAGLDPLTGPGQYANWLDVARILIPALAFFAALTATFGNLAAYLQTNLKRLLAYSTIAHAGYMLMGLSTLTRAGVEAVLFYLVAYLFTNLGAFAVVAYLRNQTGSEDLSSFRGLVRRSPWMVVMLAVFLLSLLGLPFFGGVGFPAKFQVFSALFQAGEDYARRGESGLATTLYTLLIIGGLNTVISAVYYLKVLKVMVLDRRVEDVEGREPVRLPEPASARIFATVMGLAVLVLGVLWGPLDTASRAGASRYSLVVPEPPGAGRNPPAVRGARAAREGGRRPAARPAEAGANPKAGGNVR
jgi:NADH-quinone oxidoreductase subunit N